METHPLARGRRLKGNQKGFLCRWEGLVCRWEGLGAVVWVALEVIFGMSAKLEGAIS